VRELLLVAVVACGGAEYDFDNVHHAAADAATAKLYEREVVREAAASALACGKQALSIEQPYDRAYVVTGCGHRAAFVAITDLGDWRWRVHAVDVSLANAVPGEVAPATIAGWRAIVSRASVDLGCDRDQITPDFVPQGRAHAMPIGEGCGRRASYVADDHVLRLIAIVPL
jgi:hypothetical protein